MSVLHNEITENIEEGGITGLPLIDDGLVSDIEVMSVITTASPHPNLFEKDLISPSETGQSSVMRVSYNMVNVIVGCGIVGLPFAMKQAGFVVGIPLLLFTAWLTSYSVNLLIRCGVHEKVRNYEELVDKLFGLPGYMTILFLLFLFDFGAMVAYLIILGDVSVDLYDSFDFSRISPDNTDVNGTILSAFKTALKVSKFEDLDMVHNNVPGSKNTHFDSSNTENSNGKLPKGFDLNEKFEVDSYKNKNHYVQANDLESPDGKTDAADEKTEEEKRMHHLTIRRISILVLSFVLILPLCLFRDLSKLEKFSLISIVATLFMIIMCFYFLADKLYRVENHFDHIHINYFGRFPSTAFGILAFTFVCHDSSFIMFQTLRNPTEQRWNKVSYISLSASAVICLALSLTGYFTFGEDTKQDILRNYELKTTFAIFSTRALYILAMAFTYPVSFFIARHILNQLIFLTEMKLLRCWKKSKKVTKKVRRSRRKSTNKIKVKLPKEKRPKKKRVKGEPSGPAVQDIGLIRFLILSLGLFFSSLVVVMYVTEAGLAMSLTGNICAVSVAFIIPPICVMRSKHNKMKMLSNATGLKQPLLQKNKTKEAEVLQQTLGPGLRNYEEFGTFSDVDADFANNFSDIENKVENEINFDELKKEWQANKDESLIGPSILLVFGMITLVFCTYRTILSYQEDVK